MKTILRNYLINLVAIWTATRIIPGFSFEGGFRSLLIGSFVFMIINWLVMPLLKIMFLPLNILTVGLFGWVVNVIGFYFMTVVYPQFKLEPFTFAGGNFMGINVSPTDLNLLQVAILASLVVGLISHFLAWLARS